MAMAKGMVVEAAEGGDEPMKIGSLFPISLFVVVLQIIIRMEKPPRKKR